VVFQRPKYVGLLEQEQGSTFPSKEGNYLFRGGQTELLKAWHF